LYSMDLMEWKVKCTHLNKSTNWSS